MDKKPDLKSAFKQSVASTAKDLLKFGALSAAFVAAVYFIGGPLLHKGLSNKFNITTLQSPTMADLCLDDVRRNDGVLRLPLPLAEWEGKNSGRTMILITHESAPAEAALLTDEVIAACEAATDTRHSARDWQNLLSVRPQ